MIAEKYQLEEDYGWQKTFFHPQKSVTVDLHWELTPSSIYLPFKLDDFETLWQRTKCLNFEGESIIDFSAEDLFLILALQIAKAGYEGREHLIQICDFAELISLNQMMDWKQLIEQVSRLKLERSVFISLLLVNHLLNLPLSTEITQAIEKQINIDPVIIIFVLRMENRLLRDQKTSFISQLFQMRFYQYLMSKGSLSKIPISVYLIRYFLVFIIRISIVSTTQADKTFFPLPSFLSFLYYIIRPIRLVIQHGLNIGRKIEDSEEVY